MQAAPTLGTFLTLSRPSPVPGPVPPAVLLDWLDPDCVLDDPWSAPPALVKLGADATAQDGRTVPEAIAEVMQRWLAQWQAWAQQQRDSPDPEELFSSVWRLVERARKEDLEIAVGVGLVSASGNRGWSLRQHVLTGEVHAELDADDDVIRLSLADGLHRLDEDSFDLNDGYVEAAAGAPLPEHSNLDPLSPEVNVWLEAWRERHWRVAPRWQPILEEPEQEPGGRLVLTLSPALFLRPRESTGVAAFYEQITQALEVPGARVPLGLAQLVQPLDVQQRRAWLDEVAPLGADLLLPLASNEQQRQVVDRLHTDAAVVVQGPPGTGKTHTIANLICALLADGLRVLVSSRSPHPLRVIHKLLPDPIRKLAVLAPGTSPEDRKDLDRTVIAVSEQVSTASVEALHRDISDLQRRRADLRQRLDAAVDDLCRSRGREYRPRPFPVDGYDGTPTQLVAAVELARPTYDWIGHVPTDAGPSAPLSDDDAMILLRLLRAYPALELDRHEPVPDSQSLVDSRTVARAVRAIADAQRVFGDDLETASTLMTNLSRPVLQEITDNVEAAADMLAGCGLAGLIGSWDRDDWRLNAVTDLLRHRNYAAWSTLSAEFDAVAGPLQIAVRAGDGDVDWPAGLSAADHARLLRQARRLYAYVRTRRRLRWLLSPQERRQAAELLGLCTVAGRPPTTMSHLHTLISALQAESACSSVVDMCQAMGISVHAGTRRLQLAQLQDVKGSLEAINRLVAAKRDIEFALRRPDSRYLITTPRQWDLIVGVVRNASRIVVAGQWTRVLEQLSQTLLACASAGRPESVIGRLLSAVTGRDADGYAAAYEQLVRAYREQQERLQGAELAARLATGHPQLAHSLRDSAADPVWDQRLRCLQAAWDWARAADQVGQRHAADGEREHSLVLDELEGQLRQVTEDLAGKTALLHFRVRTELPQWQALQSFRSAVNRFGKTGGNYKADRSSDLRSAIRDATRAIPVLLMPVNEVAATVPAEADAFDVVIVDEASQVTVDSVFLLWLAPRAIVVGDDKQCTPGQAPDKLPAYWRMTDVYLDWMPRHLRRGFGPDSNLYEIMSTHLLGVVRLVEHFRCMPEIIGWSSEEFYGGGLLPLRQFGAQRLDPLVPFLVEDPQFDGLGNTLRNHTEAAHIVERIQKMTEDPRYATKSIGVIVLYGSDHHTRLLNQLIDERVGAAGRKRHQIRVGDAAAFQGDERDVILLSMVVVTEPQAATARVDRQRYNVAASRARDQVWLFLSVPDEQLRSEDLRRSLLVYFRNPPTRLEIDRRLDGIPADRLVEPFDSLLHQQVFLELRRRDYAVVVQYRLYGAPIDLLVVGDNGQLAVECHSPAHPLDEQQLKVDLQRERELRRSDWHIVRIYDSDYQYDPQAALNTLWQQLQARGIEPSALRPALAATAETWTPVSMPDSQDDEGDG
ncbi:AAA domain-containing protein [Actinoplanes rectilineatus]|uniref:AAA domain-containing protein n=1 Tax=Actinoplanes rectilineatus TaxID=113571 RepID=UPI00146FFA19|nr:AAA domain-containing protein [Actinoplanes rectilineatus]